MEMIHPIIKRINEKPDDDRQIEELEKIIHGEYSNYKNILEELLIIVRAYNNLFLKMDKYVLDGVYKLTYLNEKSKMSKEKIVESNLRSFFSELSMELMDVNNQKAQIDIISKKNGFLRQWFENTQ